MTRPAVHLICRIILICITVFPAIASRAQYDVEVAIDTDAGHLLPDTTEIDTTAKVKYDWKDLLRTHRLNTRIDYPDVIYPKFLDFCLKIYRWADRTFNYYDPGYVRGAEKPGKIRLTSDNWLDMHYIRFSDGSPMVMVGSPYSNLGVHINYNIISFGYSVDINRILTGRESTNRKWNMSLSSARLYGEAFYWRNDGKTKIRDFGENHISGKYDFVGLPFDGLSFRSFGVMGLYIFNHRKFSYMAGYNLSPIQVKSQGSWIAGMSGTFYTADFDFWKLPPEVTDEITMNYMKYRFNYNSVNLLGGYSFNWVINNHFLFNIGLLLGQGITFSFDDSTTGRKDLYSTTLRHMTSLTYTNRQFFATVNSSFHGNLFVTNQVGYMSGVENFQLSAGVRF